MYYTSEQIIEMAKRAEGYQNIPLNFWIASIRSNEKDRKENEFECVLNLMYGNQIIKTTTCTTVPGLPALLGGFKRYNSKGAAVVCADIWMYDSFKYGLHAGRMPALRMVKPVWSTRDGNMNSVAEEYGERSFSNVSCNIHASTWNSMDKIVRRIIGAWSYGCTVCNNREEYNEVIKLAKEQKYVSAIILTEFSV